MRTGPADSPALTSAQLVLAKAMSENEFLAAVREMAKFRGWLTYHTRRSKGSEAGFPDLVLVRRDRLLWRELKTQTGVVSKDQKAWIRALLMAGQDAGVWRPEDLLVGRVKEQLQ